MFFLLEYYNKNMKKIYINEKKKQIVDVIATMIDDQGLKNISIKQICYQANISIGTFYHYFESKDKIVDDMFEVLNLYFFDKENEILDEKSNKDAIIKFVHLFGAYVKEWGYYANILIMRARLAEDLSARVDHDMWDILKKIVQRTIDSGELDDKYTSEFYKESIKAIIRGSLLEWIYKKDDFDIDATIQTRVGIFLGL